MSSLRDRRFRARFVESPFLTGRCAESKESVRIPFWQMTPLDCLPFRSVAFEMARGESGEAAASYLRSFGVKAAKPRRGTDGRASRRSTAAAAAGGDDGLLHLRCRRGESPRPAAGTPADPCSRTFRPLRKRGLAPRDVWPPAPQVACSRAAYPRGQRLRRFETDRTKLPPARPTGETGKQLPRGSDYVFSEERFTSANRPPRRKGSAMNRCPLSHCTCVSRSPAPDRIKPSCGRRAVAQASGLFPHRRLGGRQRGRGNPLQLRIFRSTGHAMDGRRRSGRPWLSSW